MSSAFVRESDEQSLQDISPTVSALTNFLTRENNGVRVYEKKSYTDDAGRNIHVMSNGLSYYKDESAHWQMLL
jgi:hypothetical protein